MMLRLCKRLVPLALVGALLASQATAQPAQQAQPGQAPKMGPTIDMGLKFGLQPRAIAILKAASAKLAAAKTLSFTAVATYESPARTGQPLAYTTLSEVTLERPNKLRVITPYDGPASEFYYDGKTVMAFEPAADLVAVAKAPPTIDEMLKAAYDVAAIYFPFTDLIVSNPYEDLAPGLKVAFYMGQSKVVGDTTTDIIVIANDTVQAQIWIGAKDHLVRMVRATYFDEPGNYRHQVAFSHWLIDPALPPGTFTSVAAANARRMRFGAPEDKMPQVAPAGGSKP
jgi:hypothetical protein